MNATADRRSVGAALMVASALAYSTAGVFTRLISLDVWTLLLWRGFFAGLFLGTIVLVERGWRRPAWPGLPALAVALASSAGMICYIHALRNTDVADVAVIYAVSPFVTALLAFIILRERPGRSTLAAGLAALGGVAVMTFAQWGHGHLLGNALALGMTVCVAVMMLLVRRYRALPMIGAACLASFLTSALAMPLAAPSATAGGDLSLLALFGISQLGLGLLFLTLGAKRLPAAEASLIGCLDVPLAPLWMWVGFGDVPSPATFCGGAIVLVAVVVNILAERR